MAVSASDEFKPAVLIPVYNHEHAIEPTLNEVLQHSVPVLLVNDGSSDACTEVLNALAQRYPEQVALVHRTHNGGKGAAVKTGFHTLVEQGYTHAIQIDADGQHDVSDLPTFLELGAAHPDTLIAGYPHYDHSVPTLRYYARYLTHVWVWINSLSLTIKDGMCGFRVYPLKPITALLAQHDCGDRMSFDVEILVRWVWLNRPLINQPTQVRYPLDGVSHFDLFNDNVKISWMHTRLFFGMLWRIPWIIGRRLRG